MKNKRFRMNEKGPRRNEHPQGSPMRAYEGKLDSKKRIVLRGARHRYYEVREQPSGSIILTPKELVDIKPISARTMKMIENSVKNLKKGVASEPIDLSPYRKKFDPSSKSLHSALAPRRK